jgi:adenosine deaminase
LAQICQSTPDEIRHHVQCLEEFNLPYIICTDDKGVFNCSLSSEYDRASALLKLSNEQLFQLSKNSIQFAFASVEEKNKLEKMWHDWRNEPLN